MEDLFDDLVFMLYRNNIGLDITMEDAFKMMNAQARYYGYIMGAFESLTGNTPSSQKSNTRVTKNEIPEAWKHLND